MKQTDRQAGHDMRSYRAASSAPRLAALLTTWCALSATAAAAARVVKHHHHTTSLQFEIAQRQLSSHSPPPACVHGYLSAADRRTCICNIGWTGPRCNDNAIPSCKEGGSEPCYGSLRFSRAAREQSCECLQECVAHTRSVVEETFGAEG